MRAVGPNAASGPLTSSGKPGRKAITEMLRVASTTILSDDSTNPSARNDQAVDKIPVTIMKMGSNDVGPAYRMIREEHGGDQKRLWRWGWENPELVAGMVDSGDWHGYVAVQEGQIVGFVMRDGGLMPAPILHLLVAKECAGQRIATRLVRALMMEIYWFIRGYKPHQSGENRVDFQMRLIAEAHAIGKNRRTEMQAGEQQPYVHDDRDCIRVRAEVNQDNVPAQGFFGAHLGFRQAVQQQDCYIAYDYLLHERNPAQEWLLEDLHF